MQDTYDDPTGSRHYLLSADEYDELKNLQCMLSIMANIASDEDAPTDEDGTVMIPRWEMQLIFQLISRLIGEALEHLEKRHRIEPRNPTQH